jgi:cell wall-associated NlpC family hydrolase
VSASLAAGIGAGALAAVGALAGALGALGASAAPAPAAVPARWAALDQAAAATCPGLPWQVLAAIGKVETDFGPGGEISSAGAEGPMQFEPATFAAYDHPVGADRAANPAGSPVPPSIWNLSDSIWAAARYLCANGGGAPATLANAVFAYNHSASYVAKVLSLAASYATPSSAASGRLAVVVDAAWSQIGVPYVWGGETPGRGFDCSGLAQWAYAEAGISIPRTTFTQWDSPSLVHLPAEEAVPGDLVYFVGEGDGGSPTDPGHVGIYLGGDQMIDAPTTGETVQVDTFSTNPATGFVGFAGPAS